jgi:hypothetical protein
MKQAVKLGDARRKFQSQKVLYSEICKSKKLQDIVFRQKKYLEENSFW